MFTSSPTTSPPLSNTLLHVRSKSLRLSFVVAVAPRLKLPRGSFTSGVGPSTSTVISLVTPWMVRSPTTFNLFVSVLITLLETKIMVGIHLPGGCTGEKWDEQNEPCDHWGEITFHGLFPILNSVVPLNNNSIISALQFLHPALILNEPLNNTPIRYLLNPRSKESTLCAMRLIALVWPKFLRMIPDVPPQLNLTTSSARFGRTAISPWPGRFKLCCQAKKRGFIPKPAYEVDTHGKSLRIPV